jgi:hypothetical protein
MWSNSKAEDHCRRSPALHAASNRITSLATKAVDTLGRLLDSESEQIQLSAARAVLDGTVKMHEKNPQPYLD